MDDLLINFFRRRTVLGECPVSNDAGPEQHAHVLDLSPWSGIVRVARAGEHAANQAWPQYPQRRRVVITRFGSHTRVVLTALEEEISAVPRPQWA
ncbi:MAG TPA: hypothetical protein VM183_14970 [Burkholderiales bacterium]|nr:hypothetical protein [Burkholderiales bacterium]